MKHNKILHKQIKVRNYHFLRLERQFHIPVYVHGHFIQTFWLIPCTSMFCRDILYLHLCSKEIKKKRHCFKILHVMPALDTKIP